MATIKMNRQHNLSLDDAKARVDKLAQRFADRFQIQTTWDNNALSFNRAGVSGTIAVAQDAVAVDAELGFLLGWLKPMIETEIDKHFDEHFS